jgi:hypothetical protein
MGEFHIDRSCHATANRVGLDLSATSKLRFNPGMSRFKFLKARHAA